MPHFHIPLQAGNNEVLKAMNRKYTRDVFSNRVEKILSLIPHACIATDIISGFPSETDEQFTDACQFINSLDIAAMHVFTYSERPNTKALGIKPVVPNITRKHRTDKLLEISDTKKDIFHKKNQSSTRSVLFESTNNKGFIHGFTDNYIKVKTKFDASLVNQIRNVTLMEIDVDGVYLVNGDLNLTKNLNI